MAYSCGVAGARNTPGKGPVPVFLAAKHDARMSSRCASWRHTRAGTTADLQNQRERPTRGGVPRDISISAASTTPEAAPVGGSPSHR